jgi:glutamate dehydrogenase/leucine dehydrogenase
VFRIDNQGQELGFIVVDSTVCGRARGGLRLAQGVTEHELRAAARAMTLKYGLLGLSQGGAKAGLHGDPDAPLDARRRELLAFGRRILPLLSARIYVPDADLGTKGDDIRWMMQTLEQPVGRYDWRANRSGDYTAVSCVAAARAALTERGRTLKGARVAIEGFGGVGAAAAALLARAGARVVAVSTSRGAVYDAEGLNVDSLRSASLAFGSRFVDEYPSSSRLDRDRLLELDVDLLCPCARAYSIHARNVTAIQAGVISPGANNPVTPDAEASLGQRGVLLIPDFVSNCGGVLGGTLEFAGVTPARIAVVVDQYVARTVRGLLRTTSEEAALRTGAEALARARHAEVRHAAEHPGARARLVGAGLALYRAGWIPPRLMAPFAVRSILSSAVHVGRPASR